jgi:hypothetical protein
LTGTSAGITVTSVGGASTGALTLSDATITNTTGDSIVFAGGSSNLMLTGEITQTANNTSILSVSGGHDGTLVFNELAANSGVVTATMGDGLQFDNADGTYTFNDEVALSGTDGAGIDVLADSDGTFTFADADIDYSAAAGSAVTIDGSAPQTFTISGDLDATDGTAVEITNNDGGSMIFNADITATNAAGIVSSDNSGGAVSFSGAVMLDTGIDNAVAISNNTGGSTSFSNIDIETTTADGFSATNSAAHTVTVTGTGNTIDTTTGVGLRLDTVAVGGGGVNFASVDVNGAANGIVLNNVTGGSVNIGAGATTDGAGGMIQNTTGNAIDINNVASVSLNRIDINGTAATFDGIEIDHTGSATSSVTISNTQIDDGESGVDYNRTATATSRLTLNGVTIANTDAAGVAIDISGTSDANITINNGTSVTNSNNVDALSFNTSGGSTKTVRLLVDGSSQFNNNSATASAANFQLGGTGTINATVTDSTFNNAAAGRAFEMASTSASTVERLNLDGNIARSSHPTGDYLLNETAGDFNVVGVADVATNNSGTIEFLPNMAAFDDDPGPVPQPQ